MDSNRSSSKSAFSLVEIMIALSIFAMVMLSVGGLLLMASRLGQASRNRIEALQDARAIMENLADRSYSHADLSLGNHSVTMGGNNATYVVTELEADQTKHVVLTLDYQSFQRSATIELQTVISNALH